MQVGAEKTQNGMKSSTYIVINFFFHCPKVEYEAHDLKITLRKNRIQKSKCEYLFD